MYGCFYAQKLHFFRSPYQKATVRVQVKSSFFCHKLLFRDIKLSDLGRRNRSYLPMTALNISKLYFLLIIATKHET